MFPETRYTLIQRLAGPGKESDWRQFLLDYWGPVCRFAVRRSRLSLQDAEDVASQTFQVLLQNRLLEQWVGNRSAKLRTLLCSVVCNILANRARVQAGRARLIGVQVQTGSDADGLADREVPAEQVDSFYAAWVDDLLQQAVELLLQELHRAGKGDYFRVLYGRLCEQMTMSEVAAALGIEVTSAENYFKAARKRLSALLEDLVRQHVLRYTPDAERADEFVAEWAQLGDYLTRHGGLEEVVRAAHASIESDTQRNKTTQVQATLSRIMSPNPSP